MRNYIFAIITSFLLIANTASAAVSYSQSVTLEPGWSIVSTPRILESHTFSASSSQFSIFTLDPARPSGWATMADLGQTEFTPLYGYFINNQTATSQILTFNYKASTTPNERLFDRSFATSGWYAIGVANPSYAKFQGADIIDTDNAEDILSIPGVSAVVDFTDASYSVNPDSLAVDGVWKTATSAELSTVNDLRETKGYAVFVSTSTTLSGMQSEFMPACLDGVDNDGDSRMDYVLGPTFDFGCSSPFDTDEYNLPAGSLSVEKSQLYASQQVIVPAVDQKIGEFIVHTGNDTMYIGAVVVDLQNSSTTLSVLTDLYFTQDGTATPQYATGTAQMVWFGEGETFLPNSSTTISVFATLPESMPAGDTIIPKLFVAAISLNSGDIVTSEWVIGQMMTASSSTSTPPVPPPGISDWSNVQYTQFSGDGNSEYGQYPAIAWSGSQYGAVWEGSDGMVQSAENIFFQKLDPGGNEVGSSTKLTSHGSTGSVGAFGPNIVWNGSRYGIAWTDNDGTGSGQNLRFMTVDLDGHILSDTILSVPNDNTYDELPGLKWTGSSFAIAWRTMTTRLYIEVAEDGLTIIVPKNVASDADWDTVHIPAFTGRAVEVGGQIYFSDIGVPSELVSALPGNNRLPFITWNGSAYAIVWMNFQENKSQLFFGTK